MRLILKNYYKQIKLLYAKEIIFKILIFLVALSSKAKVNIYPLESTSIYILF